MSAESQWVTFKVAEETLGFEIQYVKEMLRLPEPHVVPHAAPDSLGVILLRSEVIPIFDLRRKFGMQDLYTQGSELCNLLRARQRDHEEWLNELRRCAHEKEPFTLTTDPHQCKFGQWYDTFQSTQFDICRLLERFDQPHAAIHAVGAQVVKLQQEENFEAAAATSAKTILDLMIVLFGDLITEIEEKARPSLIVVGSAACTLGVAVDEISAVVRCRDDEIQPPDSIPGVDQFGGLIGLLPQKGTDKFIMLLDPAQLYPQLILRAKESPVAA
ncbi:chemotaxis protein CheW [bacterium]|nr:chemotaxis protein CheW [bacterium]MBU1985229.1 chemotaxis protein CheW [bacterium]